MARESLSLFNIPMSALTQRKAAEEAYRESIRGTDAAEWDAANQVVQQEFDAIRSNLFGYESPEMKRANRIRSCYAKHSVERS